MQSQISSTQLIGLVAAACQCALMAFALDQRCRRTCRHTRQEQCRATLLLTLDSSEFGTLCLENARSNRLPPILPLEIWREIISHATETFPATLSVHDISVPTATSSLNIPESEFYAWYRQSLQIKYELSQVCRAWNELTREFRFENIWVTSYDQLRPLYLILQQEEQSGISGSSSCGWWIRKIHIDLTRYARPFEQDNSEGEKLWHRIIPLASKCPRLLHYRYTLPSTWQAPEPSRQLIQELFPRSARYANEGRGVNDWTSRELVIPTCSQLTVLEWPESSLERLALYLHEEARLVAPSLARLESLVITSCRVRPDLDSARTTNLYFPSLKTLKADGLDGLSQPTHWDLPALRGLSLAGGGGWRVNGGKVVAFLLAHGQKLKELELLEEMEETGLGHVTDISTMCPNLETLQISASALTRWNEFIKKPMRLKRVALLSFEKAIYAGLTTQMLIQLAALVEMMSLLEVLQDKGIESDRIRRKAFAHPNPEGHSFVHIYGYMERILANDRVKFVDWRGERLVCPNNDDDISWINPRNRIG